MILDARDSAVRVDRSAQIVIVGAGPAGLTLANELNGVAEILVIEAGGLENDPEGLALLEGECSGLPYPFSETRARQFGGSSAIWAGYCAQFDEHDFWMREWVPQSGWPFGLEQIQPHYTRVAEILNLEHSNFDALHFAKLCGISMPFDQSCFVPTVWRFGTPTVRFGESYRQQFERASDITTLTHANVVDIKLSADGGSVREVIIRTVNGREGRISLGLCILACGGFETPRLLLNADSQIGHGVGNGTDMVGRCFMEHPHVTIPSLIVRDHSFLEPWTRRSTCDPVGEFTLCVGLSSQLQKRVRVANGRAHVYRTPSMGEDVAPKIGLFMEQVPNPESRVTLSDKKDRTGMRRIRLNWCLTEMDWRNFETTARLFAAEFERLGAGTLSAPVELRADSCGADLLYSNHQLGTTRMSTNRQNGVVDSNCRVHELSNLYIVGGSVFPTVSWANPTFTVIALTLRLADHLRKAFEGGANG